MGNTSQVLAVVAVAMALLAAAGCGDSEEVTRPSAADVRTEVHTSTLEATLVAPSAVSAADGALSVMSIVSAPTLPARASVFGSFGLPECPSTFTLPGGITGTCTVGDSATVTIRFEGSRPTPAGSIDLSGTLIAEPAAEQPAEGTAWLVELDVVASGPLGDRKWDGSGSVVLGGSGAVIDYDWTMTTAATQTASGHVTVEMDDATLEIEAGGPLGHVVRFDLDRTLTGGTVSVDGEVVAVIVFSDGCAIVDFADARIDRLELCPLT